MGVGLMQEKMAKNIIKTHERTNIYTSYLFTITS